MGGKISGKNKRCKPSGTDGSNNSFDFGGKLEEVGIFGNGHINETYCAVFSTEAGQKRYILQKMNKQIFKDPVGLMENISGVTSWLKKKILENGGDASAKP